MIVFSGSVIESTTLPIVIGNVIVSINFELPITKLPISVGTTWLVVRWGCGREIEGTALDTGVIRFVVATAIGWVFPRPAARDAGTHVGWVRGVKDGKGAVFVIGRWEAQHLEVVTRGACLFDELQRALCCWTERRWSRYFAFIGYLIRVTVSWKSTSVKNGIV